MSNNKTTERMADIGQLVDVFMVTAGNQVVTQCAPDKDYEKSVYHKLVDTLKLAAILSQSH